MSASEILVIFLSVALAVFLVLGIVLAIYLIIIAQKIKRVADTAERTIENVEGIVSMMRKAAAPAMISNFVMDTVAKFTRRNKSKEDD
jgi:hypothetical protein